MNPKMIEAAARRALRAEGCTCESPVTVTDVPVIVPGLGALALPDIEVHHEAGCPFAARRVAAWN